MVPGSRRGGRRPSGAEPRAGDSWVGVLRVQQEGRGSPGLRLLKATDVGRERGGWPGVQPGLEEPGSTGGGPVLWDRVLLWLEESTRLAVSFPEGTLQWPGCDSHIQKTAL